MTALKDWRACSGYTFGGDDCNRVHGRKGDGMRHADETWRERWVRPVTLWMLWHAPKPVVVVLGLLPWRRRQA